MIERKIQRNLLQLMDWFPIVAITGPRQSGKTTLAKATFPNFSYINLEDRGLLTEALEDPTGFIKNRDNNLVIDEAQLAPDLFSAIQVVSDERGVPGQYVLSGSQNFLLTKSIKQSLAGRCAYVTLLPLSFAEIISEFKNFDFYDFAYSGGYPRLYDVKIPAKNYYQTYVKSYIERDVSGFLDVRNLHDYQKLMTVLANQAGNLVNLTNISNACNIAMNTTKSWLSMLEASYIIFTLQPYFANIKKRLTKTPKLYFYDTGLLCYLLGIRSAKDLRTSEYRGAVIENLVIAETIKNYENLGVEPELYFYRDDSKIEINLLDFTDSSQRKAFEIKTAAIYEDKYAKNLISTASNLGVESKNQTVLMNVDRSFKSKTVNVGSIKDYLLFD